MKRLILLICITLFSQSDGNSHALPPIESNSEKTLSDFADMIVGRYTNTKQYTSNSDDHYHMELSICRIWEDDQLEGRWFYVEHSMFKMLDKPIRQFIWNVKSIDANSVVVSFYEIPNKKQYCNTCRGEINNSAFDPLSKRELTKQIGCDMILTKKTDGSFEGNLKDLKCETEEGAAKFLQSNLKLSKKEITLKDQGYNENGEQVWGPTDKQEPYLFKKVAF